MYWGLLKAVKKVIANFIKNKKRNLSQDLSIASPETDYSQGNCNKVLVVQLV